jgi:hypothetical protein
MAKDKKKEHEQLYPNYVYRPQRARDKDGKTKNKKTKKIEQDTGSLSFVVPIHRHYGRSASAPTPPPYQSIQIPKIYHMTPSCPTSPSLLPMISRRSAYPGHPEEVMSSFDYLPNNSYAPQCFPVPGQFEANLQSSEFLRNMMFNTSGASSPSSAGPYTPVSTLISDNYIRSDDACNNNNSADAQAQAEIDLQVEMQMQQEFAACSWGTTTNNDRSLWGSESVLLRDDFDLNSIPPIELVMPKYTENLTLAAPVTSGLEFGNEFLEGQQYLDDSQNLGDLLGFDEIMAGHGF